MGCQVNQNDKVRFRECLPSGATAVFTRTPITYNNYYVFTPHMIALIRGLHHDGLN